jgi:hypothetical protein
MRLFLSASVVVLFMVGSAAVAGTAPQVDLSGSWTFTWDNDDKNTNRVTLRQEAGTFTGAYMNDSGQSCPVAGRFSSATGIVLVIMCPGWDIESEGSIVSSSLITGKYLAYGDSAGDFRLSRN